MAEFLDLGSSALHLPHEPLALLDLALKLLAPSLLLRDLAPEVIQAYRALTAGAPEELTSIVALATMPEAPSMVMVVVTWCGDLAEGERVLAPIRSIATPMMDMIAPMPYGALQAKLSEMVPAGFSHEGKSAYVSGCSDERRPVLG